MVNVHNQSPLITQAIIAHTAKDISNDMCVFSSCYIKNLQHNKKSWSCIKSKSKFKWRVGHFDMSMFLFLELAYWLSWIFPKEKRKEEMKHKGITLAALWPDSEWCLGGCLGDLFFLFFFCWVFLNWPWGCQTQRRDGFTQSAACFRLSLVSYVFTTQLSHIVSVLAGPNSDSTIA